VTVTEAHNFLSWCGRFWLGRKDWNEYEIVSRMKTSCLLLMMQIIPTLIYALPKVIYPKSVSHGHDSFPVIALIFSTVVFSLMTWLLFRVRSACKTLNRPFGAGLLR
jgi:hypothetical protein